MADMVLNIDVGELWRREKTRTEARQVSINNDRKINMNIKKNVKGQH